MQSFTIAPAGLRAMWAIVVVVVVVMVPGIGLLAMSLSGSRAARFEVSSEGLRLRGDLYGRNIPANQLRRDMAVRADFVATPELLPARRTLGTGLPGYQAGWFRLRSGEKALVYLTDRSRAVYVPTTAGYSVLLSPADPDGFLSALRAINDRP